MYDPCAKSSETADITKTISILTPFFFTKILSFIIDVDFEIGNTWLDDVRNVRQMADGTDKGK